jgi:adenylate cyclase
MERRLAAILAADVAGYTRLMGKDEAGTLQRLTALREGVLEPLIAEHTGRIVKLMGDGLLVEFASIVDAVGCAVAWQTAVDGHEAERHEDDRLTFRIGVNLGDVIVEGDDIHGDGVNIAARLEGLAEPGGIYLSGDAYRQVRGKIEAEFEDLGERKVKNVAEPLRVYRIAIKGLSPALTPAASTPLPLPDKPSIAVLPFTNMSGDPEQEYFSDGLTEDIITALAAWRSFPVIARNSAFVYKGRAVNAKLIGRELGARYILEGSVRKTGNRVRITAQLIDASTGHHVWAERLDRDLEDVFQLQDELTLRIATTVEPQLRQVEHKRLISKTTNDLNAWDCYLRGMSYLHQMTKEGNVSARRMFERAVELDSTYGEAFAALAHSHLRDILLECTESREDSLAEAFAAARRAVALGEASAYAHSILSQAYLWRNEHRLAVAEAERAVELNPYDADLLGSLGNRLDLAGDGETGIAMMEEAQRLYPQNPMIHMSMAYLARAYLSARQYERSVEVAQKAVDRQPDSPHAHYILAMGLGHLGRRDEARAALDACERLHPGFANKRADWQPYPEPAKNKHLRNGLRKAGLPN